MLRSLLAHSTTVLIGTICILLFGASSYKSLPREAAPDIPVPVVMVSTPYIGVAPGDIEGLIPWLVGGAANRADGAGIGDRVAPDAARAGSVGA